MNKKAVVVVVIVALMAVGGVIVALTHTSPSKEKNSQAAGTSSASSDESGTQADQSAQPGSEQRAGTSFTVHANDDSADVTTLNVKKGANVSVTFKVSEDGVYHGGLEFKSDAVSSGPIKPGASKTVTFTADKSFDFTPYWYESQIRKPYLVSVKVSE